MAKLQLVEETLVSRQREDRANGLEPDEIFACRAHEVDLHQAPNIASLRLSMQGDGTQAIPASHIKLRRRNYFGRLPCILACEISAGNGDSPEHQAILREAQEDIRSKVPLEVIVKKHGLSVEDYLDLVDQEELADQEEGAA